MKSTASALAAFLASLAGPSEHAFAWKPPVGSAPLGPGRRGANRRLPRSRTPGRAMPAGNKLSRMALEGRLVR